ncbi:MAG: class I SAM-dependent methyltransferase, partial [Patescibacteria group bacterium]
MKNKNLAPFYNSVYKKGERKHYTSILLSGDKVPPAKAEVIKEVSWKGKIVLDAGCGTGELAYLIAKKGAKQVIGVDYSQEAIALAERTYRMPNLKFICNDIDSIKGRFDVITTLGTIEHTDDPLSVLKRLKNMLMQKGSLIVTCPNWVNPRGY